MSRFLVRRCVLDCAVVGNDLPQRAAAQYGEPKVVTYTIRVLLRMLQAFGLLAEGERFDEYRFVPRLEVSREVSRHLVWNGSQRQQ